MTARAAILLLLLACGIDMVSFAVSLDVASLQPCKKIAATTPTNTRIPFAK
ncbi:MAG: hypothetical protein HY273_07270 [Gammaproteobacteria bacterium]|nr:hypothetical protein [Gammaproteobacteria bacterium]